MCCMRCCFPVVFVSVCVCCYVSVFDVSCVCASDCPPRFCSVCCSRGSAFVSVPRLASRITSGMFQLEWPLSARVSVDRSGCLPFLSICVSGWPSLCLACLCGCAHACPDAGASVPLADCVSVCLYICLCTCCICAPGCLLLLCLVCVWLPVWVFHVSVQL